MAESVTLLAFVNRSDFIAAAVFHDTNPITAVRLAT